MNISVLGSGFAGLAAVQQLRKKFPKATIRVIAPSDKFVYYPSLIWVPTQLRQAGELSVSLRNFYKKQGVEFIKANVTSIKERGRVVETDQGAFDNEGLIIATGPGFIHDVAGIEHANLICEGFDVIERVKAKLATMTQGTIAIGMDENPQEISATRGVGPVLEFVFGIDKFLRDQNKRNNVKLVFFSRNATPAYQFGGDADAKLADLLKQSDVEVVSGQAIKAFTENSVELENQTIEADLILFQPGMTGAQWLDNTDLPRSSGGLVQADEFARVQGLEKTYVAGDLGSYPGPDWQLKLGVAAVEHAGIAAHNLSNELNGQSADKKIGFKLVYIIDMLNKAMLLKRSEKGSKVVPPILPLHFVKRALEWVTLRKYK